MIMKKFNDKFINYYKALKNMYVDNVEKKDEYTFISSNIIDDGIWTFICNLKAGKVGEVKKLFESSKNLFIDRVPRFYILSDEINEAVLGELKQQYNVYCEDSWFCTNLNLIDLNYKAKISLDVKLCDNKEDIIETIMKGFSTGDPNDPYGDLSPTYREALEVNFGKENDGFKSKHFVAYYKGKPISIATITHNQEIAYLNNVTTLKEFKGKGVAKEVLTNCIKYLKETGVSEIMFATETGEYTENFYKNLGFKVVNYGYCFEEK